MFRTSSAAARNRGEATTDFDKEKLQEHVARLSGGLAVIKVGAATEVGACGHNLANGEYPRARREEPDRHRRADAYTPGHIIVDRSARIAIAVERYRRDHAGAVPDTLDALVPAYLSEIPADPLTGASLLYRVGSDAYTIYSVGENGVDDGGVLLQPAPSGSARPFVAGPDIGVRVLIRE